MTFQATPAPHLSALVASAAAANVRFTSYAARADLDADRFRELEQADHDARRAVRAKLAEMGVCPRALGALL
jgi:hypothetical protein